MTKLRVKFGQTMLPILGKFVISRPYHRAVGKLSVFVHLKSLSLSMKLIEVPHNDF